LAHSLAVGAGIEDNACRFEPFFVGYDPARGHPELAGVAKIGAEGLLGTAGQVALFDGGQLEDGLSQPPATGWAGAYAGPGVGVGSLDPEVEDGQPPYGDEDPDQRRITHHAAD
jgi:hypothetical protein